MSLLKYKNYLVEWIRQQVINAKKEGVIVGMSGGIDSSVVSALIKEAFPDNSLGIIIPIGPMSHDLDDAKNVFSQIELEAKLVELGKIHQKIIDALEIKTDLAKSNLKSRLRMITIYALAQEYNYLVMGTSNRAEWELGYFTKFGDGAADIYPLLNLNKKQVFELGKILKLPKSVIKKAPSANFWEGQTDEEEIGVKYSEIDKYLDGQEVHEDDETKIKSWIKGTEHKRREIQKPLSFNEFLKENIAKEK